MNKISTILLLSIAAAMKVVQTESGIDSIKPSTDGNDKIRIESLFYSKLKAKMEK